MEGDYARWFCEHPFSRYMDLAEPISGIDEPSSWGEDDDDEGDPKRGTGR